MKLSKKITSKEEEEKPRLIKKGGWIQKAVNPEHKGFCTPMTKSTCTPRRKAFAMTMKKHHGFHKKEEGGVASAQLGAKLDSMNRASNEELNKKITDKKGEGYLESDKYKQFLKNKAEKAKNSKMFEPPTDFKKKLQKKQHGGEVMHTTGGEGPRKTFVEKKGGLIPKIKK